MEMDKRDDEFQECTCIHCKATDHTRKERRGRGELSVPDGMEREEGMRSFAEAIRSLEAHFLGTVTRRRMKMKVRGTDAHSQNSLRPSFVLDHYAGQGGVGFPASLYVEGRTYLRGAAGRRWCVRPSPETPESSS